MVQEFKLDLEEIGFKFNAYDLCVVNKLVDGKQHMVRFHMDELMSSHKDGKVNNEMIFTNG